MQTFKFDLRQQVTAVVPEAFLNEVIKECSGKGDTPPTVFLQKLWTEHTERMAAGEELSASYDILVCAVLTNALRKQLQAGASLFLANAGIGSRVSPVEVLGVEFVQPRKDSTEMCTRKDSDTGNTKPLTQGEAVQALQDIRVEQGVYQTAPPGH